ncbi:hypothetical protein PHYPSEUDO_005024 [Phytophthora pseudosyringae]|uniref:Uncharacterized protein n=1 Tax=Phytophthora pseudosyringae TaxID=221518 RepID=A0A8T1VN45_9STRA|nr:hypothetical protein PHYPSEUDO_005024 [Phytophthora pseudosyringae]
MNVFALIASGAIVLASVPSVLGHGYITDPAATWKDGYAVNGWGSSIDSNMWGAIDTSVYGYGTMATVAFFEAEFNASGYNSLGQFIETNQVVYSDDIEEQCGYTVYDDSARETMPSTNLTHTGFTHPGPCEVWCDDTKVLFDYNCQATYPDIPAGIPYDESLCADANRFTIYWLAVHGAPWQVYTDCVWLDTGSGSGSAPSSVAETVSSSVATAPPTASSGSTATATTAYPDTSTSTASTATSSASTAAEASTADAASTAAEASTRSESVVTTASNTTASDSAMTATNTSTDATDASSDTSVTTSTSTTAPSTSTASKTSTTAKCSRRMRRD